MNELMIFTGHAFKIYMSGTAPQHLRMHFLHAEQDEKVGFLIYYATSSRLDVYVGQVYIDPMNRDPKNKDVSDSIISLTHRYGDVIMGAIASQITSLTIVYSTVYSDADQRKHQSSASLAFLHRGPVNSRTNGQ